jgi:hypothetical protein
MGIAGLSNSSIVKANTIITTTTTPTAVTTTTIIIMSQVGPAKMRQHVRPLFVAPNIQLASNESERKNRADRKPAIEKSQAGANSITAALTLH